MGDSVKRTLYYEFYGLPGCGKSTISHLLAERLRQNGANVLEPSYHLDHTVPPPIRAIRKLLLYCSSMVFKPRFFSTILTIVRGNGYNGIALLTQTSNVLQKLKIYLRPDSSDIVIWDQGLIQAAISLSAGGRIGASENYQQLRALLPVDLRIIKVQISIDSLVAFRRMENRKTNDSRIEKISGEKRQILMARFVEGVKDIETCYSSEGAGCIVNGIEEIDKQVEDIYTFCLKNRTM